MRSSKLSHAGVAHNFDPRTLNARSKAALMLLLLEVEKSTCARDEEEEKKMDGWVQSTRCAQIILEARGGRDKQQK